MLMHIYELGVLVCVSALHPKHLVLDCMSPKGNKTLQSMNAISILGLNMILSPTTYSIQIFYERKPIKTLDVKNFSCKNTHKKQNSDKQFFNFLFYNVNKFTTGFKIILT